MMKNCFEERCWRFSMRKSLSCLSVMAILFASGCGPGTPGPGSNSNVNVNVNENMNENDNSSMQQTFTVTFDGDNGATPSGTTDFEYQGAGFSGGTVKSVGLPSLYGSGLFAYEVLEGSPVTVEFENPVDLLELFLANHDGGETVLTAFDADGNVVGTATADDAGSGDNDIEVELSSPASSVEIVYSGDGDGWIDDFTFRFVASDAQ